MIVSAGNFAVLKLFSHLLIRVTEGRNFSFIVLNELFSLWLKVGKLLLQNCFLCFSRRSQANKALLNFLKLLTFGLILCLSSFLLLHKSLRSILQLSGHLILINLDPVLVSLDSALVLSLHLGCLGLGKLDLLVHQSSILLKVDILMIELVLSLIQLSFEFGEFLSQLNPL